jgi:hypothetical protein
MFLLTGLPKHFQNAVWVGRPAVGLRVKVMTIKEAGDVCHQRSDAAKTARADDLTVISPKKRSTRLSQDGEVRVTKSTFCARFIGS